jgi:hypothetical protein
MIPIKNYLKFIMEESVAGGRCRRANKYSKSKKPRRLTRDCTALASTDLYSKKQHRQDCICTNARACDHRKSSSGASIAVTSN